MQYIRGDPRCLVFSTAVYSSCCSQRSHGAWPGYRGKWNRSGRTGFRGLLLSGRPIVDIELTPNSDCFNAVATVRGDDESAEQLAACSAQAGVKIRAAAWTGEVSSTNATFHGASEFFSLFPTVDMDVTTAARLSATFPYTSPLGLGWPDPEGVSRGRWRLLRQFRASECR